MPIRALTEEANHTAVVHGTGSEQTGAAAERRDGSGVTEGSQVQSSSRNESSSKM